MCAGAVLWPQFAHPPVGGEHSHTSHKSEVAAGEVEEGEGDKYSNDEAVEEGVQSYALGYF